LFWCREVNSNSARWTASNARRTAEAETGILNDAFSLAVNDSNAVNSLALWTNPHTFSHTSALFLIDINLRHLMTISEELPGNLADRQFTDKIILIEMER